MKKLYIANALLWLLSCVDMAYADQVPVNIAYPLNGGSYQLSSAYPLLPISFSVTCRDLEDHHVKWGYNNETLGSGKFRGQFSLNFLQKFSKGRWTIWVESDCGKNKIEIKVRE